jgi:hypothetical protein
MNRELMKSQKIIRPNQKKKQAYSAPSIKTEKIKLSIATSGY